MSDYFETYIEMNNSLTHCDLFFTVFSRLVFAKFFLLMFGRKTYFKMQKRPLSDGFHFQNGLKQCEYYCSAMWYINSQLSQGAVSKWSPESLDFM